MVKGQRPRIFLYGVFFFKTKNLSNTPAPVTAMRWNHSSAGGNGF